VEETKWRGSSVMSDKEERCWDKEVDKEVDKEERCWGKEVDKEERC